MGNFEWTHIKKLFVLTAWGSLASFLSYCCFRLIVIMSGPLIDRFLRFYDSGSLRNYINYNVLEPTIFSLNIVMWLSIIVMGFVGFLTLVMAKACFSKAEAIFKERLDA